jgi:hypothetical protein
MEVQKPDLCFSSHYLDFGKGFYLTTNKEQAINFSNKVVNRETKKKKFPGIGTVSIYKFDLALAKSNLNILEFSSPSDEWFDYVIGNRRGCNKTKENDVTIGLIANDDVYRVLGLFENGILSKEHAIEALKVRKLFNQFTLATDAALNLLRFISSETY